MTTDLVVVDLRSRQARRNLVPYAVVRTRSKGNERRNKYLEEITTAVPVVGDRLVRNRFPWFFQVHVHSEEVSPSRSGDRKVKSYHTGARWFAVMAARCRKSFVWSSFLGSQHRRQNGGQMLAQKGPQKSRRIWRRLRTVQITFYHCFVQLYDHREAVERCIVLDDGPGPIQRVSIDASRKEMGTARVVDNKLPVGPWPERWTQCHRYRRREGVMSLKLCSCHQCESRKHG